MDFIIFSIILLLSTFIFLSIGFLFNLQLKVINQKNIIDLTVLGYAIFVLISFHSYFLFNIKSEYIFCFLVILIIFFLLKFKLAFKKNSNFIKINAILIFIFFSIFFLPAYFYGEQFFVFRGNYWDNFNYLSSALLFSQYDYSYLKSINLKENFQNFQSIDEIILYRPYVNYFLSLYLKINFTDLFLINFFFKVFLSTINFLAFVSFLELFKKIKKNLKFLLSFFLSLSFFSLYVTEIEALSHLASISFFVISLKYLYLIGLKLNFRNLIFFSIFSAALFIVYPEIFIIFCIISLSYIISKFNKDKINIYIKNILYCSTFFIIFTIASYKINYHFLFLQISQALNTNIDWWTYFGAFVFGKDNLVLDTQYISLIDNNLQNKSLIDLFLMFYNDHLENGYKFINLNIIPSLSGIYYLTPGKINSDHNLFLYILMGILNIYLLNIIFKNSFFLVKSKKIFILVTFSFILILIFYFLTRGNFWTIIKIYSYFFPFIYIFLVINLQNQKINVLIVILLIIFPIYKYSNFNNGIGKLDSFPSIINKDYKNYINWNLNKSKLNRCESIYTNEKDYFVKAYINMKALYYKKNFINSIDEAAKKSYCEVLIENKNFIIKSLNNKI